MSVEWQGVPIRARGESRVLVERKANGFLVSVGSILGPQEFVCTTAEEVLALMSLIFALQAIK